MFIQETRFLNHKCNSMKKAEIMQSIDGVAAYVYYSEWMRCKKHKVPDIETFKISRYFSSFVKFSDYIKRLKISKPEKFIQIMAEKDIPPTIWTTTEFYNLYLDWYDRLSDPLEQVETTVDMLIKLSDAMNVSIGDVFNNLTSDEIQHLIQQRAISPWFLLSSSKFKTRVNQFEQYDKDELLNVINPSFWVSKLENNRSLVKQIKGIVGELSL